MSSESDDTGVQDTVTVDNTEQYIETTVESEQELHEYIDNEREARFENNLSNRLEKVENQMQEHMDDTDECTSGVETTEDESEDEPTSLDKDLTPLTARVQEVSFNRRFERIKIGYIDNKGERHTSCVDSGIPEDSENKYVRLCEWVGVDPAFPTDLRGEVIPITEDNEIDYPPIQKRLNPYAYKTHRTTAKIVEAVKSRERIRKSIFNIGIAIMFLLPGVGLIGSFTTIVYLAEVGRTTQSGIVSVSSAILSVILVVILSASALACLELYGRLLLAGVSKGLRMTASGVSSVWRFLFPKSN